MTYFWESIKYTCLSKIFSTTCTESCFCSFIMIKGSRERPMLFLTSLIFFLKRIWFFSTSNEKIELIRKNWNIRKGTYKFLSLKLVKRKKVSIWMGGGHLAKQLPLPREGRHSSPFSFFEGQTIIGYSDLFWGREMVITKWSRFVCFWWWLWPAVDS